MTVQSLTAWAKAIGISRQTLRRWLEIDLDVRFPRVRRGSKFLVTESQINAVVRKRMATVEVKP